MADASTSDSSKLQFLIYSADQKLKPLVTGKVGEQSADISVPAGTTTKDGDYLLAVKDTETNKQSQMFPLNGVTVTGPKA